MNNKTFLAASAAFAVATGATVPMAALADAPRPMALMIMIDGLRADAVETAYMPNLAKLRAGEWQSGYNCAWSLDAQIAPGSIPSSAPNHTSIATGVSPSKHGVTKNGDTSKGDFATYPTWLKRVVDADPSKNVLFIYKDWEDDDALGPDAAVTFESGTDEENAASLAAKLASASAPDATMYFIDAPDAAGHERGFFPMSDKYLAAIQAADGYLGACLDAISSRATFANEDWLIAVTSDHGGYSLYHGDILKGRQADTIPLLIAGRSVPAGRIPGQPCNMDVAASALAHFGVAASGLDAVARDNSAAAEPSRPLSDGLAAYLPFDLSPTANAVSGSPVAPTANGAAALAVGGMLGNCLDFPPDSGRQNYVKLNGSNSGSLAYGNSGTCFTATLWVKMPPPVGDPAILANKRWSGAASGYVLFAGSSSQIAYRNVSGATCLGGFLNAGTGSSSRIDMGCMDYGMTNDWTFYAVTCDTAGVITLYQGRNDGTLDWVSGTLSGSTLASGFPFYIGNDASENYSKAFVGSVDDFGLWTRPLTHGEIRRIFSAGRAGIPLGSLAATTAGPATATWTGAVSSDPAVAGNWSGNSVPTFDTAVVVPGTATRPIAMGAALPCKSIFFDNATLGADIGEPGLDAAKIMPGSSIDLNGHVLRLRAGTAHLPFSVTDSSADAAHPGELRLDDTGRDIANTMMAVSGNLRFAKAGAGRFTANASTTYTGGLAVEGGTFVMSRNVAGSIYVGPGATLDTYGRGFSNNPLTLAGGTLTNTKPSTGIQLPASVTLTADSSIVHDNNGSNHDIAVPANSVWNLGGHTLGVLLQGNDPDFNMEGGSTITNGTLRFSVATTTYNPQGKGWVGIASLNGRDGLNLDLGSTYLRLKWKSGGGTVNSTVHDFTCDPPPDSNVHSALLLEVYGTYTPPSTSMGFNTRLMDGATLNLASASVPWDCVFANVGGYAGGSESPCALSFEDGATITVNLAGRTDLDEIASAHGLVATWAEDKVPDASTTFVLDPETAALPHEYYLRKTSEGLSLRKTEATTIFIR